jgi:hypothetical protein
VRGQHLKELRRHGHSDDDDDSVVLLGDTSTCLSQLGADLTTVSCYEDVETGLAEKDYLQDEENGIKTDKLYG